MKNGFSFLSDCVFYAVALFFIFFVIINFFVPRPLSYILSGTLALLSDIALARFFLKKRRSEFSAESERQRFKEIMTALELSDVKENVRFFSELYSADGKAPVRREQSVLFPHEKKTVFPKFGFDGVTKTDLVRSFNRTERGFKTVILSESFSDEIVSFAERFGGKMILCDGKTLFSLMKKHGVYPRTESLPEKKKKADFSRLLDAKKQKTFFRFGLLFILLSYFAPIKIYYLAFGLISLLYAVAVKLFLKNKAPA